MVDGYIQYGALKGGIFSQEVSGYIYKPDAGINQRICFEKQVILHHEYVAFL